MLLDVSRGFERTKAAFHLLRVLRRGAMSSEASSAAAKRASRRGWLQNQPHREQYEELDSRSPLLRHSDSTETLSVSNMHSGASDLVGEQVYSPDERASSRRLNGKMDIALLPFLSLLYLFNGLDRSNIGNAETQGTPKITIEMCSHIG
jgi:hypothetical protein